MILILIIVALLLWFAAGAVIAAFLGGCERLDAAHRPNCAASASGRS